MTAQARDADRTGVGQKIQHRKNNTIDELTKSPRIILLKKEIDC